MVLQASLFLARSHHSQPSDDYRLIPIEQLITKRTLCEQCHQPDDVVRRITSFIQGKLVQIVMAGIFVEADSRAKAFGDLVAPSTARAPKALVFRLLGECLKVRQRLLPGK